MFTRAKKFILKENFKKNQENIINNQVKLTNQTPFVNLKPLLRNPGSTLVKGQFLQRNYRKMTRSFSSNSYVKFVGIKIKDAQHDHVISKSML